MASPTGRTDFQGMGVQFAGRRVLVITDDVHRQALIEEHLPDGIARYERSVIETEGFGIDVVVVACAFPLVELTEVRVHPALCDKPVILFDPAYPLSSDWEGSDVWLVTDARPPLTELRSRLSALLLREREAHIRVALGER